MSSGTSRILIYSHDTFGLGHLRRCRTIAQSMVQRRKGLTVLILSGSPIIGSFNFRTRVDFVRIPGVIKLRNGEYSSLSLHMNIAEVLELRASIIRHTAEVFKPDLFLVDKEPLGLRGEIHDTLQFLYSRGTPLVLGLREVLDHPMLLAKEWERKNAVPALRDLYDEIWVYGLPQICDALAGIDLPEEVREKITYTGYLRSNIPAEVIHNPGNRPFEEPYILVTTGGGGDGEHLIDWVLSAYEHDPDIPYPSLMVYGPFMSPQRREKFQIRVDKIANVKALTFDSNVERLMSGAAGVVAMGGYNTFCEILTMDKPAVIAPRSRPRMEQYIRALRAQDLGLVRMLAADGRRDPGLMADALRRLPSQRPPSENPVPGLLDGLDSIHRLLGKRLSKYRRGRAKPAAQM